MVNKTKHICKPENWVENYADQLFNFANSRVNNRQMAEDFVQDTFVSALDRISSFRGDSSEKTWLYTILRNKIIDYYRSSEKKMSSKFYDLDNEKGNDHFFYQEGKKSGGWVGESIPSNFHESADQPLHHDEFMRVLAYCMEKLPFTWGEVFRMKNLDDLSSKEICKELSITSSNLWVIVHRAKLQMRACMEKSWMKN